MAQKDSVEEYAIKFMTERTILQEPRYQARFRPGRDGETTSTRACHMASYPGRGYHTRNKKVQRITHIIKWKLQSPSSVACEYKAYRLYTTHLDKLTKKADVHTDGLPTSDLTNHLHQTLNRYNSLKT